MMRIGHGYDVHPLRPGRALVLGGVTIEHPLGLAGHSDADVLTHAVASALLGSLALGDLGTHFPSADVRWKDASSLELLAAVMAMVRARGYELANCDATVIAEAPRLAPHIAAMRTRLAETLGVDAGAVSVQATTHERLGSLGRSEGIAATAVVLVAPA